MMSKAVREKDGYLTALFRAKRRRERERGITGGCLGALGFDLVGIPLSSGITFGKGRGVARKE